MKIEIKYCKRCGRRLRSAESQDRGYGKLCYQKAQLGIKPLFKLEKSLENSHNEEVEVDRNELY